MVDRFNRLQFNDPTLTRRAALSCRKDRGRKRGPFRGIGRTDVGQAGLTVAELPKGYHDIPEADRKKARVFFDRGATVAQTGNYDYAIEMYLQGLAIDPDSKEAHQALREISLKRKASGGKDLGMFEKMKLRGRGKDDCETMLRAERLMSYDPGNTDNMLALMKSALAAGFYDTALWIGPILQKANSDLKNPDLNKYLALRDVYVELKLWRQASDACQLALSLRPDDMDLQRMVKDLGAMDTMNQGKYLAGGSFRESVRDMDKQTKLLQGDMDVRDTDVLSSQISEAESELAAQPEEAGKLMKLVDLLLKTEQMQHENRAIELLEQAYERSGQFRYRLAVGKIKIAQLRRQERAERARLKQNPDDPVLRKQYVEFLKEKNLEELKEYQLFAENYPTDMSFRYEVGVRLFNLDRAAEAIPVLQQARSDPKLRVEASTYLGRSFLVAGFVDEAIDTLKGMIDEYELRGDNRSKELFYWYGLALEQKGDVAAAMKSFSQLVQWDFNYRDVQARIKRLRSAPAQPQG